MLGYRLALDYAPALDRLFLRVGLAPDGPARVLGPLHGLGSWILPQDIREQVDQDLVVLQLAGYLLTEGLGYGSGVAEDSEDGLDTSPFGQRVIAM